MAVEFFQTVMGRTFYEGTVPALVRELKKLNENLQKVSDGSLLPKLATALMHAPLLEEAEELRPTGWDPSKFKEKLTEVIAMAENSGEAAGRMLGEHLDDLHDESPDLVQAELDNVIEWAKNLKDRLK